MIIDRAIEFVKNLYESGFSAVFNAFADYVPQLTATSRDANLTGLMGALLDTFIPFPILLFACGVRVQLAVVNFFIGLVLRVKSFIPTMGGK